jgi:hypothetical protein
MRGPLDFPGQHVQAASLKGRWIVSLATMLRVAQEELPRWQRPNRKEQARVRKARKRAQRFEQARGLRVLKGW